MTVALMMVCVIVGAALVGLWLAVRVPQFEPRSLRGFLVELVLVWATLEASSRLLSIALDGGLSPGVAVMLIVFPALVIAFALIAWTLMFMRDLMHPFPR